MRRAMLAALMLIVVWPSRAGDLTVDEARDLAEKAGGVSLAAATVTTKDALRGRFIEFETDDPEATYCVNVTAGRLASWTRAPYPAEDARPTLTVDQALGHARETARDAMGAEASSLTWAPGMDHGNPLVAEFRAVGESLGSPPVTGLCARCTVQVSLADGTILLYSQDVPDSDAAQGIVLSEQQARDIALSHCRDVLGWPRCVVKGLPHVTSSFHDRRPVWWIEVRPDVPYSEWDGDDRAVEVDARTGEVVLVGGPEASADPASVDGTPPRVDGSARSPTPVPAPSASVGPVAPEPPTRSGLARTLAVPAAGVALLAALALAVRRRR